MTGLETLAIFILWGALFGGAAVIVGWLETRKEKRQMERNLMEHHLTCNRRRMIADIKRGEW